MEPVFPPPVLPVRRAVLSECDQMRSREQRGCYLSHSTTADVYSPLVKPLICVVWPLKPSPNRLDATARIQYSADDVEACLKPRFTCRDDIRLIFTACLWLIGMNGVRLMIINILTKRTKINACWEFRAPRCRGLRRFNDTQTNQRPNLSYIESLEAMEL